MYSCCGLLVDTHKKFKKKFTETEFEIQRPRAIQKAKFRFGGVRVFMFTIVALTLSFFVTKHQFFLQSHLFIFYPSQLDYRLNPQYRKDP